MTEDVSFASLMTISDRARTLRQGSRTEAEPRLISQEVLKPLLGTLGWLIDDTGMVGLSKWGKAYIMYDARQDVYTGRIGSQTQMVATSHAGDSNTSTVTKLIEYAYNKDAPWALSVTLERLRLYHTHESVLLGETRINPFWELDIDVLPNRQEDMTRLLSASAVTDGVLGAMDHDVRESRRVALPVNRKLFESLRHWRAAMVDRLFRQGGGVGDLDRIDRQVNHLLNQVVFIRVAEDRQFGETPLLLEVFNRWQEDGRKPNALLSQLRLLMSQYAERYRVDLFADSELLLTELTEELIGQLIYALHSPGFPTVRYNFSVLDVDVLGTMYEQYLRLRPKVIPERPIRQARLVGESPITELVPSDRAVGVHYTPSYIVDYIVGSSIRRWHDRIDRGRLPRVLDMACGSGSFLLAAYRWLLDEDERKKGRPLARDEKQKLLTECIWGVDRDQDAVEICKLNLWLHALEARQSLPSLDSNIRVGDSLLDAGLSQNAKQADFRDSKTSAQQQPIVWHRDFAGVMQNGGWDVIVGNPPYIRIQKLQEPEKSIYIAQFDFLHGNFDLSLAFVEMALRLLGEAGVVGYIIANSLIRANYAYSLRQELVQRKVLLGILDFSDQQVFEGTSAYTCIVFLGQPGESRPRMGVVMRLSPCPAAQLTRWELEDSYNDSLVSGSIDLTHLGAAPWVLVPDREHELRDRLDGMGTPLEKIARIFQGFKTGMDNAFVFQRLGPDHDADVLMVLSFDGRTIPIERRMCLPLVKGGDIERFHIRRFRHWVLFPYRTGLPISEEELASYPNTWSYLNSVRDILAKRQEAQRGRVKWYQYSYAKSMTMYDKPKLITPDMAPQASFASDDNGEFAFSGGAAGGYGLVLRPDQEVKIDFLLGILNSQLFDWYVQAFAARFRGGYFSYERRFIKDVPVRLPPLDAGSKLAEDIASIVGLLKKTYLTSSSGLRTSDSDLRMAATTLNKLEKELNLAIMDFYGLAQEERSLIQGSPYWRKVNLLRGE